MRLRTYLYILPVLLAALNPLSARAGSGPFGIDHEWGFDQSGIWARKYQLGLEYGVVGVEVAGALWFGNDHPLGHAFWQAADSTLLSAVAADLMKIGFSRARPDQGDNPNAWFKGRCCESFPSGEVTLQASFVTPLIVDFHQDYPWIWALEILPLYDSIARLKSQAHWQSDVLVGWALGSAIGYGTTRLKVPLTVRVLPGGVTVGLEKRF
jgi:undecaprenyl-diphosphatase